ncbi:MAG: VWA domain-containing protein [Planctomycetota bacterium JB042]
MSDVVHWVRPSAAVALLVVPAVAVALLALRHLRRRLLRRFVERPTIEPRAASELTAPLVVTALLVVALIGPAIGDRLVEVPVRAIDVLVLLDASRSMRVADAEPDRLERAKRELHDLARRFEGGRLALMTFGGDAELVCPFTRDREAFRDSVRAVDPVFQSHGGTDLGRALRRAVEAFEESDARRVVLIATDGENLGRPDEVDEVAWRSVGAGVEVHALVVGSEAGGPVPVGAAGGFVTDAAGARVRSRARPEALRPVVERTGGRLVLARDEPFPLARLVDEELSDVVAVDARTTLRREPVERSRWLLPPVLLLLLWPSVPRPARRRPAAAALAFAVAAPSLLAFASDGALRAARAGNERYAEGEFEAALERYDEAHAAAPDHPGILFNRGAALCRLERHRDAARAFDGARARADGALRARAAFGAGVARAKQAERDLAAAGDDPRRLEAVGALLREAKGDLVQALAGGEGRDAAVDLELVSLLLEELRRREEEARRPASGGAGEAPGDAEPTPDDGRDPGRGEGTSAPPPRSTAGETRVAPGEASATEAEGESDVEAPVDDEGGGEARLPGGLFREEAASIEEIVRRYERERLELDRRRARESRARAERDW